ncbi:MAG: hypothetical protein AABY22_36460 [Nanoarchaeota archaeon]
MATLVNKTSKKKKVTKKVTKEEKPLFACNCEHALLYEDYLTQICNAVEDDTTQTIKDIAYEAAVSMYFMKFICSKK